MSLSLSLFLGGGGLVVMLVVVVVVAVCVCVCVCVYTHVHLYTRTTRFVVLHGKIPPLPHCVPSDSVSQSATVSVCPVCYTWFGYYE